MKPTIEYLRQRIDVDVETGIVTWIDATKHHQPLNGKQAGSPRKSTSGKKMYWCIKVDGKALKRSHIVFLFANGVWPSSQIDHINGNSLDDRAVNLRDVTQTQNAWNHKKRSKKSDCPMGIRKLPSGNYQARIACNKKTHSFGPFASVIEAQVVYQQKRKEFFGDYA